MSYEYAIDLHTCCGASRKLYSITEPPPVIRIPIDCQSEANDSLDMLSLMITTASRAFTRVAEIPADDSPDAPFGVKRLVYREAPTSCSEHGERPKQGRVWRAVKNSKRHHVMRAHPIKLDENEGELRRALARVKHRVTRDGARAMLLTEHHVAQYTTLCGCTRLVSVGPGHTQTMRAIVPLWKRYRGHVIDASVRDIAASAQTGVTPTRRFWYAKEQRIDFASGLTDNLSALVIRHFVEQYDCAESFWDGYDEIVERLEIEEDQEGEEAPF